MIAPRSRLLWCVGLLVLPLATVAGLAPKALVWASAAIALVLLAIPILSLRPGPGFPGFTALLPCIGAAPTLPLASLLPRASFCEFDPLEHTALRAENVH